LAIGAVGLSLFYRCLSQEETDTSRVLLLDAAMKPKGDPLHLLDNASAVLLEGRDVTVFYGPRVSVLTDGRNDRAVDLGQKWDVLSVLPHPARQAVLLFGRKITGLGMLLTGDRLRLILTRPTRIVWTSLSAATVEPEAGSAKLQVLEVHSLWRNVVGSIAPTLLLFCSAALIFLGLT